MHLEGEASREEGREGEERRGARKWKTKCAIETFGLGWGGVSRSRADKVEVTIDVRVGDAVISDSFLGRYIPLVQSRAAIKYRGGCKKKKERRGGGEKNRNRDGQVFYEASI